MGTQSIGLFCARLYKNFLSLLGRGNIEDLFIKQSHKDTKSTKNEKEKNKINNLCDLCGFV